VAELTGARVSGAVGLKFLGAKTFDFKRATVFSLGHRLSTHTMERYARNFGGHGSLVPLAMPTARRANRTPKSKN